MTRPTLRQQRRRALAHQCPACRRHWALRLVEHPAGSVVVCRFCSAVRRSVPVVVVGRPPGGDLRTVG